MLSLNAANGPGRITRAVSGWVRSAVDMASLPLVLAGGLAEAATFSHALPQSFPLLAGHVSGARETVASKSAEENPAQRQNSKGLPEGNLAPAEDRRQQPIPQFQHYFAADGDKQQEPADRQRSQENPSPSHLQFLILS